jgi:hypothetical protein
MRAIRWVRGKRGIKAGLLACCIAALSAAACELVIEQEVRFEWTIDGSANASLCTTYGIATWRLEAFGPNAVAATVPCGAEPWVAIRVVEEGSYEVTVTAQDSGGQVLATRTIRSQFIDGSELPPVVIAIPFASTDFAPVANAKINVFWNINGTVNGAAKGQSWDQCAEVGAVKVGIEVDGNKSIHDCEKGGNMSASISGLVDQQSYAVKVTLLDASENAITTTASDTIIASETGGEYVVDFFYDSFLEPGKTNTTGRFMFKTTYENGKPCDGVSPPVDYQMTLLSDKGTPLSGVQVCSLNNVACQNTDDGQWTDFSAARACSNLEQEFSPVTWGMYKVRIRGAVDVGGGFDPDFCWDSGEVEILVGAGTENPLRILDSARDPNCSQ